MPTMWPSAMRGGDVGSVLGEPEPASRSRPNSSQVSRRPGRSACAPAGAADRPRGSRTSSVPRRARARRRRCRHRRPGRLDLRRERQPPGGQPVGVVIGLPHPLHRVARARARSGSCRGSVALDGAVPGVAVVELTRGPSGCCRGGPRAGRAARCGPAGAAPARRPAPGAARTGPGSSGAGRPGVRRPGRRTQHLQVSGDAGLVHADEVDQLADRTLLFAHRVEDAEPRRLCDRIEGLRQAHATNI